MAEHHARPTWAQIQAHRERVAADAPEPAAPTPVPPTASRGGGPVPVGGVYFNAARASWWWVIQIGGKRTRGTGYAEHAEAQAALERFRTTGDKSARPGARRCGRCRQLGHRIETCTQSRADALTAVKHDGSVCQKEQVARSAILPLSGASPREAKEEEWGAATGNEPGNDIVPGRRADPEITQESQETNVVPARRAPAPRSARVAWDRSDPDEDFTDLDFGESEEPVPPEARESYPDHLVAELPPAMRAIWEAVARDGRTIEEVAAARGRHRSTIYQQLLTACGRLRKLSQELAQGPTLVRAPPPVDLTAGEASDPTPAQERARRRLRVLNGEKRIRSKTIADNGRFLRGELEAGAELLDPSAYDRPRTRGECEGSARPCPWVSCAHHLALDVNDDSGAIKLNFPHLEVWEMAETCSLDVADRGGITLEEVGAILNLARERIRQVEVRGLEKIKKASGEDLGLMPEHGDGYSAAGNGRRGGYGAP